MRFQSALAILALILGCTAVPTALAGEQSQSAQSQSYTREVLARQYADFLLVDKSDRLLIAYSKGNPIRTYRGLRFGDAPRGHKRFEGDERTPEGLYYIDTRNPRSSFHLSLKISYPNGQDRAFAARFGRSAGGNIFIHGQPNGYRGAAIKRDWTDGCIALTNAEIRELWSLVPDGTPIRIRP